MTQFYTKWARWSTVLLSVNAWKKIQPVPEKKKLIRNDISGEEIMMGP